MIHRLITALLVTLLVPTVCQAGLLILESEDEVVVKVGLIDEVRDDVVILKVETRPGAAAEALEIPLSDVVPGGVLITPIDRAFVDASRESYREEIHNMEDALLTASSSMLRRVRSLREIAVENEAPSRAGDSYQLGEQFFGMAERILVDPTNLMGFQLLTQAEQHYSEALSLARDGRLAERLTAFGVSMADLEGQVGELVGAVDEVLDRFSANQLPYAMRLQQEQMATRADGLQSAIGAAYEGLEQDVFAIDRDFEARADVRSKDYQEFQTKRDMLVERIGAQRERLQSLGPVLAEQPTTVLGLGMKLPAGGWAMTEKGGFASIQPAIEELVGETQYTHRILVTRLTWTEELSRLVAEFRASIAALDGGTYNILRDPRVAQGGSVFEVEGRFERAEDQVALHHLQRAFVSGGNTYIVEFFALESCWEDYAPLYDLVWGSIQR